MSERVKVVFWAKTENSMIKQSTFRFRFLTITDNYFRHEKSFRHMIWGDLNKMSRTFSYTYRLVSRHETTLLPSAWRHCVHVMIYSQLPKETKLFNKIPISHTVMVSYNLLSVRFSVNRVIIDVSRWWFKIYHLYYE